MNIVIIGAGSIGTYLATVLSKENHNVIVLDTDPKKLEALSQNADAAARLGSGTDWKLLQELLDESPHLFCALTSDDETNLVACSIAKTLGYPKTVARIHNNSYLSRKKIDFSSLFLVDHFIGTELIVAHDIFKSILNPGSLAVENFVHGAVQMRTIVISEKWQHTRKKLKDLKLPENLLIGLIRRPSKDHPENKVLLFPKGDDVLLPHDEATLIGDAKVMQELKASFGIGPKKIKSVILAGSSPVCICLIQILQEHDIHVKIIEKEEKRCRMLANEFPTATILHHQETDLPFFLLENVQEADAFVACGSSNETNILAAALARQAGCSEVIALVSEESYAPLLRDLGILQILSERVSIANRILSIVHEDNVTSIASLFDNKANILEIKVSKDSGVVGTALSDLRTKLPDDFLIALIENKGKVKVAKGNHALSPGDTAIVICSPERTHELQTIF